MSVSSSASAAATALMVMTLTTVSIVAMAYTAANVDTLLVPECSNNENDDDNDDDDDDDDDADNDMDKPMIRIAFIGNSILYFNDCPRLVEQMMKVHFRVKQDSCLRGDGSNNICNNHSTLASLHQLGNGMQEMFATEQAWDAKRKTFDIGQPTVQQLLLSSSKQPKFDFVILNDHSQTAPGADDNDSTLLLRAQTIHALQMYYKPLIMANNKNNNTTTTIPIILETPAYQNEEMIQETEDFGDLDAFTNQFSADIHEYNQVLPHNNNNNNNNNKNFENNNKNVSCPFTPVSSEADYQQKIMSSSSVQEYAHMLPNARVAPVGEAYRWLKQHNPSLWKKLYSWDRYHPSPYGTWLQACIIYIRCLQCDNHNNCNNHLHDMITPPPYNPLWWEHCRYMQPPNEKPLPLPTQQEADELHATACLICGLLL